MTPLENAVAERINKTIKEEFSNERQMNFATIKLAKENIKGFIEFYNNQRPHRSINRLTPGLAYQQTGALQRVWKKYIKAIISFHQEKLLNRKQRDEMKKYYDNIIVSLFEKFAKENQS